MGVCKYCGEQVGLLRNKHDECEQKYLGAIKHISSLVASAAAGRMSIEGLKPKLQLLTKSSYVSPAALKEVVIPIWEDTVDHFLNDGNLDESEEKKLMELSNFFGFSQSDLDKRGAYSKMVKAAVLRDLMNGVVPQRAKISGAPFNLQKKEQLVWLFDQVDYLEDKTRREYVGATHGVSIRIMKGVYYRVGEFKGRPVDRTERVRMDNGILGVTDKHLYFAGPGKSFRIPYNKIVSFTPFSDGIGVIRDATTAKPQIFVTGDGWFTYNLVTNLARL